MKGMKAKFCGLAKAEGHCNLIPCINYFNKFSAEKHTKEKKANIWRQVCIAVQMSHHITRLVNEDLFDELSCIEFHLMIQSKLFWYIYINN